MDEVTLLTQKWVDKGVLVQDPDGLLWLSDEMKKCVDELNQNEDIRRLIRSKAKDEDDFKKGCWTYIYSRYKGHKGFTQAEVDEAVLVLMGWNKCAELNEMLEWSMRLRFR